MKNNIYKYLKLHCSAFPNDVDRLIVSAFIDLNKIKVRKNKFVKSYLIDENETEEYAKLCTLKSIIKNDIKNFSIEELIELFEFVISPSDRIVNGAIYTPSYIREYISSQSFISPSVSFQELKIADVSCGCGGFLYTAATYLKKKTKKSFSDIFKNHIYGLDIQDYSVTRTKLLLSILALSNGEDSDKFEFNLYVGDALDFIWSQHISKFKGFNIIMGNPPYVCSRHFNEETKKHISNWEVSKSGHPDLYIPFFQIGIENLAPNGVLGYITMNSFFKSVNGRALREYFQRHNLEFKIIDFGSEQIFKSRLTYTCICIIKHKSQDHIIYTKSNKSLSINSFNKVLYSSLDSRRGWNLQGNEIVAKIESTGTPFGNIYKTRNGIATLKNDVYIFNPVDEDNSYYYLNNGNIFPIEKDFCRNVINSNRLSKVDDINKLNEKIIFPYDDNSKPRALSESYVKKNFPKAYNYLENKKSILAGRDKGKGEYERWFAFGRNQSLEKTKHKLFFPAFSDKTPNFLINSDEHLLHYNGIALLGDSIEDLIVIKKLMQSKLFWFYIKNTSKPYGSGYFALSRNYIKNFGVCSLTKDEINQILEEDDMDVINDFFERKYDVTI